MNKAFYCFSCVFLMALLALSGCAKQEEIVIEEFEAKSAATGNEFKVFNIYTDKSSPGNHYIPSGWMGDFGDIKLNDRWMENSHSGTTCIRIEYVPRRSQGAGWMGIYWQNPANNWGSKKSGFDLTGAKQLSFYARGEKGGEIISEFKIGGISGEFSDSDSAGIGPAMLTQDWKKYEIDLKGKDLSHIIGGFCFSANSDDNPDGFIIYLDEIKYE
ncbi:MAG: hypothetical protein PHV77_03820 [Candidatus Omnitrophica bacterium]|jgi:hypothetical protein|nr:hypothetical protein [Candidatus Omnitrophota bacterium]